VGQKAVLLGARSEVARELSLLLAPTHDEIVLVARNVETLQPLKDHLQTVFQCDSVLVELDVLQIDQFDETLAAHTDADLVMVVFGYLGDQAKATHVPAEATQIIDVNYRSAVLLLNLFGNAMRERSSGMLVGISSVAGERGRKSNYIYGSAKAGLTAFLGGLRNDLFHDGVHVMTVKPGFMATRMTEHLKLPSRLTVSPTEAAKSIMRGVQKKKNVIYVGWQWALIMFAIRNIPESIFKRMKM